MKTNTEISFSFWLTLFYSIPLLALTDRLTDGRRNEYTRFAWAGGTCPRFAWAGGTFFPVVLLCQFWFWREIGSFFVVAGNFYYDRKKKRFVVAGKFYYDRKKKFYLFCCGGKVLLRPEKKRSSIYFVVLVVRLAGCAM